MGNIGHEAVGQRTGLTWREWYAVLDEAGALAKSHAEILAWITEHHPGLGSWWTQKVAVEYERVRGLRDKHQRPVGYAIGTSRRIHASIRDVYRAWRDDRLRSLWLPGEAITIRASTPSTSLRITWSDGETLVDVELTDKGPAKCQVHVRHKKLRSAAEAQAHQTLWEQRLTALKAYIEG